MLLGLIDKVIASSLIFEVGDDILAGTEHEAVQTAHGLLQYAFLAAGDDKTSFVLHEDLCCHLS